MHAFIGLGSNIGDGPVMIRAALDALNRRPGIRVARVSALYRTAPWGRTDQADFTNAVAELATDLEPEQLLQELLDCETALGRKRSEGRWGPRRIDLDLLCVGQHRVRSARLVLPHPGIQDRAFVLIPLLELEPEFQIPGNGSARVCLEALEPQRVVPIE